MSQDFKTLIDKATYATGNKYLALPEITLPMTYLSGAERPNELLLKALEALDKYKAMAYVEGSFDRKTKFAAETTIDEIVKRLEEACK